MGTKTARKTNGLNATAATLRPLADRVVAKAVAREEMTKSGIVLPDTAKEKPQRGTVVAVGEGRRDEDGTRIPLDVQVGDQILFAKYAGTEFKLDEEELSSCPKRTSSPSSHPKPTRSHAIATITARSYSWPRFWSSTPRRGSP